MSLNLTAVSAFAANGIAGELTFQGDGVATVLKLDLAKWPIPRGAASSGESGIDFKNVLPSGVSLTLGAHPAGYTTTLTGSLNETILTITFGTAPPVTGTVAVDYQLLYAGLT